MTRYMNEISSSSSAGDAEARVRAAQRIEQALLHETLDRHARDAADEFSKSPAIVDRMVLKFRAGFPLEFHPLHRAHGGGGRR